MLLGITFVALVAVRHSSGVDRGTYSFSDTYLVALATLGVISFAWVMFVSHYALVIRVLVLVCASVATVIMLRARGTRNGARAELCSGESSSRVELFLPAVAVVLVGLRGMVPILPLGISLGVVAVNYRGRGSRPVLMASFLATLAAVLVARQWSMSEPFWYWLSYDQYFRASLATGLTRWGYTDLNSAAGLSIHYHWMSEAISGVMSRIGAAEEYLVVSRLSPVLFFTACVAAMWRLVRITGVDEFSALAGVSLTSLVLLEIDPYSIGTLLGAALFCRFVELLIRFVDGPSAVGVFNTATMLSLLMLTQTPFGLTALVVATGVVTTTAIRSTQTRQPFIAAVLAYAAVAVLLRLTLLQSSGTAESQGMIGFERLLQFGGFNVPVGVSVDSPTWLRISNSLAYLLELSIFALPAFTVLYRNDRLTVSRRKVLLQLFGFVAGATVLLPNVLDLGTASGKLFSGYLLILLPVSLAFGFTSAFSIGLPWRVAAMSGAMLLATVYWHSRNISNERLAATAAGAYVIFVVGLLLLWIRGRSSKLEVLRPASTLLVQKLLVILPIIMVVSIAIGRQDRFLGFLQREPLTETQIAGSPEVFQCLYWIRDMSDPSAIIATDLFDPPLLPGSGKSHIVSLVTRRRVLLDGRYLAGAYVAPLTEDRTELLRDLQQLVERTDFLVVSPQLWQSSDVLRRLDLRVQTADCVVLQRNAQ
jgi:hypothetical protein